MATQSYYRDVGHSHKWINCFYACVVSGVRPKSDGLQSERVPSSSIASANKEVESFLNSDKEL